MTYCVGMRLDAGLVFLADSRTNAGVDQVGTFRKLSVFENPGERMMVLMTSGNLSISQAVRQIVASHVDADGTTIWNAPDMYAAARIVGAAVRTVHREEAAQLAEHGVDFNIGIVFGGQIRGERCRLFYVYSAGNFIESHDENPYFQIGEAKYGKPIIDRVVSPRTSLDDAAKCALVSMDSTLRSNISVGLPLDLLVYEAGSLAVTRFVTIDEHNEYFRMLRATWGQQLKAAFEGIAAPVWDAASGTTADRAANLHSRPVRMALPTDLVAGEPAPPLQSLADQPG
ncbi:MAG: peptidase, partial [Massilia sp.]|nr:peptidase [Massilia sp.]